MPSYRLRKYASLLGELLSVVLAKIKLLLRFLVQSKDNICRLELRDRYEADLPITSDLLNALVYAMAISKLLLSTAALASLTIAASPYDEYIFAPSSRTLHPVSVYKVNGTVSDASSLTGDSPGNAVFTDPSAVTFDFENNIAGLVTLEVASVHEGQYIGIAYTESSLWISGEGSDATADTGLDEAL
ncbi:hypothetical protein LTR56_024051 [Elasticomyces elasticus]|nr:hypothetical protein LTR56_024051 [Elasticomyces elasticus]KAK4908456.1 hypothetical protein LTR49_022662 [Elasticomyces elasticus]KAK5743197.1 hypothetical protein LTS12_023970 [Elasticomyces elasticus]